MFFTSNNDTVLLFFVFFNMHPLHHLCYGYHIYSKPVKQNKLKFSSIEINKLNPVPACGSDSSSEAKSSCCQISDAKSHLVKRVVSSAWIAILQITSSGRSLVCNKIGVPRTKPYGNPALTGYSYKEFQSRTT